MDNISKVNSMSLWIFIVPFFAINACLILITQFHSLFPNPEHILHDTIPYIDGKASISRTARVFPTYLIFKPAMFLTSFLLIKYWLNNKKIILYKDPKNTYINKFVFFGIKLLCDLFSIDLAPPLEKFDFPRYLGDLFSITTVFFD